MITTAAAWKVLLVATVTSTLTNAPPILVYMGRVSMTSIATDAYATKASGVTPARKRLRRVTKVGALPRLLGKKLL